MGALVCPGPEDGISQLREVDFRGGLGLTLTACWMLALHANLRFVVGAMEGFWALP
jgi:hypothetical protein